MNILDPNVIDDRTKSWTERCTDSEEKLRSFNKQLTEKYEILEREGRLTPELKEIMLLTWRLYNEAGFLLTTVRWSAEDYTNMRESKTFRIITKIRSFFKR